MVVEAYSDDDGHEDLHAMLAHLKKIRKSTYKCKHCQLETEKQGVLQQLPSE